MANIWTTHEALDVLAGFDQGLTFETDIKPDATNKAATINSRLTYVGERRGKKLVGVVTYFSYEVTPADPDTISISIKADDKEVFSVSCVPEGGPDMPVVLNYLRAVDQLQRVTYRRREREKKVKARQDKVADALDKAADADADEAVMRALLR